jgi:hypothetical protein
MSESPKSQFWFRAKPYGWGFGPPNCWQGWAVLIVYTVVSFVGCIVISVVYEKALGWSLGFVGVASLVLFAVCMCKGPKLRWRSDEKDTGDYPLGQCQTCGYDLTGNLSGVCPECGVKCETD